MTMTVCFTVLFWGNSFRSRFRCSYVYNACFVCVPNGCFMCVPAQLDSAYRHCDDQTYSIANVVGNNFGEALLLLIVAIQLNMI